MFPKSFCVSHSDFLLLAQGFLVVQGATLAVCPQPLDNHYASPLQSQ